MVHHILSVQFDKRYTHLTLHTLTRGTQHSTVLQVTYLISHPTEAHTEEGEEQCERSHSEPSCCHEGEDRSPRSPRVQARHVRKSRNWYAHAGQ